MIRCDAVLSTDLSVSAPSGNLHFVNVVSDDYKGGATYTCVAENRVMRGFQQGEFNTVIPHGGTASQCSVVLICYQHLHQTVISYEL